MAGTPAARGHLAYATGLAIEEQFWRGILVCVANFGTNLQLRGTNAGIAAVLPWKPRQYLSGC